MLPRSRRVHRAPEFRLVMRSGRRSRRGSLVVHRLPLLDGPSRAGLVVSRAVGPSVVRHRVSRRLRAQLAEQLPLVHPPAALVVRALPGAADADSAQLRADLTAALRATTGPAAPRAGGSRAGAPRSAL